MSRCDIETRWMKFSDIKEFIIINDNVIAIASGINVMFLDLITGDERIEKFDSPERGKGACCLAGHPVIPMFATAERRYRPKIFIFTYPGIRKIANCILERGPNGYLSCVFAGTEYLLTLTSFPDFRIIVWFWRTGEYLTSINTTIADHRQRIACSPFSPYQISQLGEISGNLAVYDINVCSRIIIISPKNDNFSLTNKIVCSSWTFDGNLFHCDVNGNVTLNINDGKKCRLIVRGDDIDMSNSKGNPLIKSFRSGIILVNRESQIVFYRKPTIFDDRVKSGSPWRSVWSVRAPSHPVFMTRSSRRDTLLFSSKSGEIFELSANDDADSPKIRIITYQGSNYEFLMSVNPHGDHVVAIDEFDRLSIFQCLTGHSMTNVSMRIYGRVRCAVSHPNLPILAIGTAIGKFVLINLTRIAQPSIHQIIHLQRESLEIIRYSWSVTLLGIADRAKLFIVDTGKNERYSVIGFIHSIVNIIDFLIYENSMEFMKILVLAKTGKSEKCGRKIIVYSFDNVERKEECKCVIEMTNTLDSLWYGRNEREIIVIPYLTKQLHFLQIQGITLTDALSLDHQLRNIKLCMNDRFIVTCGYDGLIITRSATKIQKVLSIFMLHHRFDGGAETAILFCSNNTIVSLGRNGDLAATKIRNVEPVVNVIDPGDLSRVQPADIEDDDLTWMERKVAINLRKKREECTTERNSILEEFLKLRERLKILLDANEHETTNSKLPISDFNLNEKSRDRKIHEKIAYATGLEEKLENEISQRNKVSKYLLELCWDSMKIHACSLLSINGKTRIDNFPVPRVTKDQEDRRKWESFIVEFEYLDNHRNTRKNVITDDLSIVGTTTHKFLPEMLDSSRKQIKKCPSYNEGIVASIVVRDREKRLKMYFNKLFEEMRSVKEHELNVSARRLEEIESCTLELKNTFEINSAKSVTLLQPLWHYSEKPETIVTISDWEMSNGRAAMYLERDTSVELMRKRDEENLKLNDTFREEALEIMMDGLLEVRWEDEIKKDPPRPSCLSTKDPGTFTAEEIAELEIYRMRCDELRREREKYKKMLENKIIEVEEILRQDIECFDRRLEKFYLDRMKIESAILQETSMRLRESRRHSLRRRGIEIMQLTNDELTMAVKEFRDLSDVTNILESAVNDTRNRYENLSKRDKILNVKFRGEFADLKQPMVEHLSRHYRKRPRNVQLTCTSITFLNEISKSIVSGEKSEILPIYCLNFLQGMDSLDTMPNNLPAQIDTSHWMLLCKLRRAKVELEIKTKICALELAEAEQTFTYHQKSCTYAENRVSQLKEIMREREIQQREKLENTQVQLVLKMGQIETQLYGDPFEFSNALLVPLFVVEGANNAIIAAGRKKLAAMRITVVFRRTILWREWRHECLRITLNNMGEELKVLQGVKVTREIQNYMLTVSRDIGGDKEAKTYERILASTKKRFSGILKEQKKQYDDTDRDIASWRKKNERDGDIVEKMKLASFEASMLIHDENRERNERYRKTRLKRIMKRTRLTKRVQGNYGELLALQMRLELLRLKTYPTLRLRGHTRGTK